MASNGGNHGRQAKPAQAGDEQGAALRALRGVLVAVLSFSGVINLLALTGSLFMLQVYDRVLTSRSVPTLVALCAIALGLYAVQGVLEVIRSRLLVRLGARVDEHLAGPVFRALVKLPLRGINGGQGLAPMRDLDTVRTFLSSQGPAALADLPWIPIYIAFVFLLHPLLGWATVAGALVLVVLTIVTEFRSRESAKAAAGQATQRFALAESARRNAEVVTAMGFAHRLERQWLASNDRYLATQEQASDVSGGLGAVARIFRLMLQSAILALGAWLTIRGEVSAGVIIASSIASARALAPVDQSIANWKGFSAARQSWGKIREVLAGVGGDGEPMPLPAPEKELAVEALFVAPPGQMKPVIQNITMTIPAGSGLAIIGPSASGKSTLVRALAGVWPATRGEVRLDGASIDHWSREALGQHVGYLPQDIELFDGTVAQNISRFAETTEAAAVVAAARAAGVHEMILRLPDGYDTRLGEGGATLSAGQRQRLGLARALYGDPFLVILDEPNAHLDAHGEAALVAAIQNARARGAIVILVAHRPSVLAAVDLVAVIANGALQSFGPRDKVLSKHLRQTNTGPGNTGPAAQLTGAEG